MSEEGLTRRWKAEGKRKPRRRGFELQEERAARAHPGGERTRGSGCSQRPGRKGDSVGDLFRQESKQREKPGAKSMRVQRDHLEKITAEARATGHRPMLVFGFDGEVPLDWGAFPLNVCEYMTKAVAALLAGDEQEAREWAEMVKAA